MNPLEEKKALAQRSWKERVTLRQLILSIVLLGVLSAVTSICYRSIAQIYTSGVRDTRAILFLETERRGELLSERIFNFEKENEHSMPVSTYKFEPSGEYVKVQGAGATRLSASEAGVPSTANAVPERWVARIEGQNYLVVRKNDLLNLWNLDFTEWFQAGNSKKNLRTFLATKDGVLLFSDDKLITQTTYPFRTIVQKYILSQVREMQLDYVEDKMPMLGSFSEVPRTNLMLFNELPKMAEFTKLWDVIKTTAIYGSTILGILMLSLHIFISRLIKPVQELVGVCNQIGRGNFEIRIRNLGVGELSILCKTFVKMAGNLRSRDAEIRQLNVRQKEQERLEGELKIAQSIQENFFPKVLLPVTSGVEVASRYVPAAECAGDWYGYFFDERSDECIFAIADVNGHGAGSALFTSIIAAAFEETKDQSNFSIEEFAKRLNRHFFRFGAGRWYATMLVAKYKRGGEEVEILNAGHTTPLFFYPSSFLSQHPDYIPIPAANELIGFGEHFKPLVKSYPFPQGTRILFYTDGLTDVRIDDKPYREKRLHKIFNALVSAPLSVVLSAVHDDWTNFLNGTVPADDMCLLAIKKT